MRPGRIVAVVIGSLLVVPALAVLLGGGALGIAYAVERDDDGYFDDTIENLSTDTVAVTAEDLDFLSEPGRPDWVLDALDVDIRLRVTGNNAGDEVFVGIAREADLDQYLSGVAHAEVTDMDGIDPIYRVRDGGNEVALPADQDIWVESASGPGTQQLVWEATDGRWAAIVMNADGSPGVDVDANVGARSDVVLALAVALLLAGVLATALAISLIVFGASSPRTAEPSGDAFAPPPPWSEGAQQPAAAAAQPIAGYWHGDSPVTVNAMMDPELSRWKWLIKWFLAIPHFIVLAFMWVAFAVLTFVAGVAILFTGSYPRGIFDFNVGVLRWTWRVQFYATSGGIGSDRYPPFSLHPEPGDHASIDIEYPARLSRPRVLVKWLLAIPHLIIVALLAGSTVNWLGFGDDDFGFDIAGGGGVLGILTLVAGVVLLFTNEYPRALFDLIIGLNRWVYRVVAYVALMTDDYPPFRLDQGGTETGPTPPLEPTPPPIDLRNPADDLEASVS